MKKLAFASTLLLLVLLLGCSSTTDSTPAAEYVGTWVSSTTDSFGTGAGTLTIICTANTLHFGIAADGSMGVGTADFTLTVDTAAKHMAFVATASSGSLAAIFTVGDTMYTSYSVSGSSLYLATGVSTLPYPAVPTSTTAAITMIKQ
jgi:hypothetical protein